MERRCYDVEAEAFHSIGLEGRAERRAIKAILFRSTTFPRVPMAAEPAAEPAAAAAASAGGSELVLTTISGREIRVAASEDETVSQGNSRLRLWPPLLRTLANPGVPIRQWRNSSLLSRHRRTMQ